MILTGWEAATGKPRDLHVDEAMQCIDFSGAPEAPQPRSHVASHFTTVSRLVTSEYFKIEKVRFSEGIQQAVPYNEPVVWVMLEGEVEVKVDGMKEPTKAARGETVLLPAKMENPILKTVSDAVWLEVTFPVKSGGVKTLWRNCIQSITHRVERRENPGSPNSRSRFFSARSLAACCPRLFTESSARAGTMLFL